jgi:ABC-type dipeptide/oligopeptide/nickel transport system permease subunit
MPVVSLPAPIRTSFRKRGSDLLQGLLRDKVALCCLLYLLLVVLAAILAPWIAPYSPYQASLRNRSLPPNWVYWLGTDEQGRDILSRCLFGARSTLLVGAFGLGLGGLLGCTMGILAAFYKKLDGIIMRLNDVLLSFPAILIGFALVGITGPGVLTIILALSVATVPPAARIARSAASSVVHQDFVTAGRAIGLSEFTLITRYVLRNCLSDILVFSTLWFAQVILLGSALSFLGLGPPPPAADLGTMVSQGRSLLLRAPHVSLIPCFVILSIILALNLLGDALRDITDPRSRA